MRILDTISLYFFRRMDNAVEWAEVKGIYSKTNFTFHFLLAFLVLLLPILIILKLWLWARGVNVPSDYPNQRILDARYYAAMMKNNTVEQNQRKK